MTDNKEEYDYYSDDPKDDGKDKKDEEKKEDVEEKKEVKQTNSLTKLLLSSLNREKNEKNDTQSDKNQTEEAPKQEEQKNDIIPNEVKDLIVKPIENAQETDNKPEITLQPLGPIVQEKLLGESEAIDKTDKGTEIKQNAQSETKEDEQNQNNEIPKLETKQETTTETKDNSAETQNETDSGCKIPPNLQKIVYHSENSLTYKALNGETLPPLTEGMYTSIAHDLRKYIDICSEKGLISEAFYVQVIHDNIKNDKTAQKVQNNKELHSLETKIKQTNDEIEERNKFWNTEQEKLDRELQMSLQELEMQKDKAFTDLDNEWKSPQKMQLYSKPSPALLNMRDIVKRMIKAKKFEDVQTLSKMIEAKEHEEAIEAQKRMDSDYRAADQRLVEKFEHEEKVIRANYEKRKYNIQRLKEKNFRPINQRLENLTKQKDQILNQQKKVIIQEKTHKKSRGKITTRDPTNSSRHQNESVPLPSLIKSPKLTLQGVTPIRREKSSHSSAALVRPRSGVNSPRLTESRISK